MFEFKHLNLVVKTLISNCAGNCWSQLKNIRISVVSKLIVHGIRINTSGCIIFGNIRNISNILPILLGLLCQVPTI